VWRVQQGRRSIHAQCGPRWNGTAWKALGAGLPGSFYFYTLAIAPNGDLYVSGIFSAVDGVPAHNLARKKQKALALAEGFLLFAPTPFK
jgi:hypothetical protein